MPRKVESPRRLWASKPTGVSLKAFVANFRYEFRDDLAEFVELIESPPSDGDEAILMPKFIEIKKIYLKAVLQLRIIEAQRNYAIDEFISGLIRKKLKEAKCLCFKLGTDGKIEVFFRLDDDGWTAVKGQSLLPCSCHMLACSKWDIALRELEDLINSPGGREHDLQKFFEVYPELLAGKDYDTVIPQAVIVPDESRHPWKADFVLSPFDQFAFGAVLELKMPTIHTMRKSRAHQSLTARVWHAIRQIRDYGDAFDSPTVRARFSEVYHVDIFRPDLHLIIGSSWSGNHRDAVRRIKRHEQVRIETWQEVLDRLKRQFS